MRWRGGAAPALLTDEAAGFTPRRGFGAVLGTQFLRYLDAGRRRAILSCWTDAASGFEVHRTIWQRQAPIPAN
ncbi:hypothetical protein GXW78_08805 [Roseomonas terrae]|uniref:Histidine kinase/HSP90-like ATPase domain-containing protein n=1 Tax=Neoroseomonas terrae TaxID=424799 RepID=A0ABS5EFL6_9PROT|nr:hypothetical protein [Neoroseomonas terrae]MBR0649760.1 hypothetical protein [Neoroseomonas terrae]